MRFKFDNMRRGQVSVEFIVILVIGFVLLSGALYFVFMQSQTFVLATEANKAIASGNLLSSKIDEVAVLSQFSKTIVTVTLPDSLVDLRVLNYSSTNLSNDLVLSLGETDSIEFLFVTQYPFVYGNCIASSLNGVIGSGQRQFVIESCGGHVALSLRE
jgi:hypothetical protein